MLVLTKHNSKLQRTRINKQGYWHRVGQKLKKYGSIYWFVLPAAFLALLFGYIPLIFLLGAFKENVQFGLYGPAALFQGGWTFQNFISIFTTNSDSFFSSLGNTLVINLLKLVLIFPLPILLAICLSEVKSTFLAKLFLIILCLPNFLSWPTVIGIWQNFFRYQGVLNNLFGTSINFFDYNLFGDGVNLFKFFAIFLDAWKGMGWNSIMFYTAIMSIDKSYYEAAELDGASKLQQIGHLTLPSIFPIIALMFIMNITYILSCGFEQINLIAQWNPEFIEHETTLDYYLYHVAMREEGKYPLATALGLFNSTISLIFMLVGNKICRKFLNRGLW